MSRFTFTSESVSEGHPDKVCDYISDSVLDACFEQDPRSRVACETLITTGLCLVAGEITTNAYVDVQKLVREMNGRITCDRDDAAGRTHFRVHLPVAAAEPAQGAVAAA